jgi:hypothetical protein
MSGIVAESGYIRVSLAELNGRVDRMEVRADRVARRRDLADSAVGQAPPRAIAGMNIGIGRDCTTPC